MSNAQQIEHRPGQHQDAAAQTTQSSEPSLEFRPDLKDAMLRMNPADAGPLGEMLKLYPNLSREILSFAASHLGNAFVQRAIAVAQGSKAQGRGASMSQDEVRGYLEDSPAKAPPAKGLLSNQEMHEFLDDGPAKAPPAKGPLSNQEMHEFLDDGPAKAPPAKGPLSNQEMHEFLDDGPAKAPPTAAPKATPAAEPVWVAGARAYNAAHSDLVDEFNDLTDDVARLGGEAKVDPQAVARWQGHHGLAPGGKMGPPTVAKARTRKAKGPAVAAAQTDARPPV